MEFENKIFWKFTTALGRKLSDGHLFFTKLFLTVCGRPEPINDQWCGANRNGVVNVSASTRLASVHSYSAFPTES